METPVCSQFLCPLTPPLPNSKVMDFLLNFNEKDLKQNCEYSAKIANKPSKNQKFRKGVGGQRGLARRNPSNPRDLGLFSVPFFLCPLRRTGTHFWRTVGLFFEGLFVANPLPPTPFRTSGKIANKQNYEQTGVSDSVRMP